MDDLNEQLLSVFDRVPLGEWLSTLSENVVDWLTVYASSFFDALMRPVEIVFNGLDDGLAWLPWPLVVLAFGLIGWRNSGRQVGFVALIGMMLIGFLGYWELAMETLAMVLAAMVISVVIGVPLGILSSRNDRLDQVLRLVLDGMQTIHPFVYLVPIVMLLSIGNVPSIIATIIFALPPIVRLTNLGIRQVPHETVEAGRSFGASERQLLWDVQIPLAMPTIMAGLNQTLMLSLSMVVIAALIAGGGLGQEILRSVGRLDIGRAVVSGLAVLLLAIVLDRVSQGRKPTVDNE